MTTRPNTPSKSRKQTRQQQRLIWVLGLGSLLFLLITSSVASIGRNSTEQQNARNLAPLVTTEQAVPPNAEPNGRAWGPIDAPIQVIAYVDYECESCGYFARENEPAVVAAFAATNKVRFEVRNAPFHGAGARNAAAAAYCAADQNAFWPMHDSLYLNQPTIEGTGPQAFSVARVSALAAQLSLDTPMFDQCMASGTYDAQGTADLAEAQQRGVTGTPTFFINGQMYPAVLSVDDFQRIFRQVAPTVDLNQQ